MAPKTSKKATRKKKTIRKKPKKKVVKKTKKQRAPQPTTERERGTNTTAGGKVGGNRRSGCRPTQYSEKLAQSVLDKLINGQSMIKIMQEDVKMPHTLTVYHWTNGKLGAPPEFKHEYARARHLQADNYAEKVLAVAESVDEAKRIEAQRILDDLPDDAPVELKNSLVHAATQRSTEAARMQMDALKWTSARMHPKSWGDRVAIVGDEEEAPVRIELGKAKTEHLERLEKLEAEMTKDQKGKK